MDICCIEGKKGVRDTWSSRAVSEGGRMEKQRWLIEIPLKKRVVGQDLHLWSYW